MTAPKFGMQFSRPNDDIVATTGADFSKTIVIDASEDASNTEFPLDTAVRFSTSDRDAVEALGSGPLRDHIRGVADQLDGINAGADVTVVRIEEGDTVAETAAAIAEILDKIETIPSQVNATPRIIIAGRTDWRLDADTTNLVLAKLDTACGKLLAVAPVDVNSLTAAQAIDDRETLNSQRLIPIGIKAKVFEDSALVTRPMASRVAGLFIRADNENFGKPFDTIANRPVRGIAGLSRPLPFSLLDGSTEGQQMLEANVSIVVPGEVGVDGAVADGGFIFIGTDNAATAGDAWQQIHQVRGADFITVKIMQITRQFLGRRINGNGTEAWLNSLKFMLRDHVADGDLLGSDLQFRADRNSPDEIRLGHLLANIGIEQAPAFTRADHEIRRYRPAVEGLIGEIVSRLSTVA